MDTPNLPMTFLFSGQGSQYRGMGQRLFEYDTIFRESIEQSDLIVQKQIRRSLIDELYSVKQVEFDDLLITHPAIIAVEIALYRVLQNMAIKPQYVAGNSLGEFAAAVVNGIWSEKMAIEASIEQAKSIAKNSIPGGMIAIINHRQKDMEHLYLRYNLFLAADNFDEHFTLAGSIRNIDAFQSEMNEMGVQFFRLPVAFAFHSPLIEEARNDFIYFMDSVSPLSNPNPGFVSGIKCEELKSLPENYFWDVVSRYANVSKMVKYIENKGPCFYIDLGPSGSMATFVKYNLSPLSASKTFQIMTPFKREKQQLETLQKLMSSVTESPC